MGNSDESPHEAFYYYFRGNLNAVRRGKWKYFEKHRPQKGQPLVLDKPELYDLNEDIGETNNVAADHPNVVARMKTLLDKMRHDLGDDGLKIAGVNTRTAGHVDVARTLTIDPPDELRQKDVFISGQDGYHTYRIPALITTQKGSLLAICEGRAV